MVESQREIDGKITQETRFYLLANVIGPMIRDHWAAENCLHWVMEMVFHDGLQKNGPVSPMCCSCSSHSVSCSCS
jgi:hypothetical protein